jgi:hypothetical protein
MSQPYYPGSQLARRRGCSCPIIENGYGDCLDPKRRQPAGAVKIEIRDRSFWIDPDCEIHRRRLPKE